MPTNPAAPIKLTTAQARQLRAEGVEFWPRYDEKHDLIGWKAGVEGGGEAHAPIETFQWVPHERKTWPWRYATLKKDINFFYGDNNETEKIIPAGTTVKIVMVSRLGDVGITDDLSKDFGYQRRVSFDDFDEYFDNRRNEP